MYSSFHIWGYQNRMFYHLYICVCAKEGHLHSLGTEAMETTFIRNTSNLEENSDSLQFPAKYPVLSGGHDHSSGLSWLYQWSMEAMAIAQGCPGLPVSEWWVFLKGFGWEDWQCLQVFPGILITRKKHNTVISDCHLKRHPVRLSWWRHSNSYYRTLVSVTSH